MLAFFLQPEVLAALGGAVFAGLTLAAVFAYVKPEIVEDNYHVCRGGWHEAYLNDCKDGLLKIPQQPVNTYTNLAYLAAGLYVDMRLDSAASLVFVLTMTYLCIGSSLYHATSTQWGGMLDVTAIYAVFSSTMVYALAALVGCAEAPLVPALMFVVAGLAAYFLSARFRRHMEVVIGIFLICTYLSVLGRMAVTESWSGWPLVATSFALFALAYWFWNLDRAKAFPLKRWGHGFWHLLTAVAAALIFYIIPV
jgi:predicted membrane channel-forming protein YqfA (hemolysin III family)